MILFIITLVVKVRQRRKIDILEINLLSEVERSIEGQTLRQLKRFFLYEKLVKSGTLPCDFSTRLSRVLLDEKSYSVTERGNALELIFCEIMNDQWDILQAENPDDVFYPKTPSRLQFYLKITDFKRSTRERASHLFAFMQIYKKHAAWFREIGEFRASDKIGRTEANSGDALKQVMDLIRKVHPDFVEMEETVNMSIVEELRGKHEKAVRQFEADLEFAEDRAERAHARLRRSEEERATFGRQLKTERENGEKLRQERSDRIGAQRKALELQRAIEVLQRDHVKLERRLREMAVVLAKNESNNAPVWNIDALRAMSSEQLLGINPANVSGEVIDASRRRFASALHPDRVRGLPSWTEKLFAELMKLVNEASDNKRKK